MLWLKLVIYTVKGLVQLISQFNNLSSAKEKI